MTPHADSGLKLGFKACKNFSKKTLHTASEMMGVQMMVDQGVAKDRLRGMLMDVDLSIKPTPMKEMRRHQLVWLWFDTAPV